MNRDSTSKLDAAQREQLQEIGTYLKQVRQEQAITLEEVTAKTYIPMRLLRAIEAGQADPLPEPVFIQGFIRRYADILGLDGMALAKQFAVDTSPLPSPPTVSEPVNTPPPVPPSIAPPPMAPPLVTPTAAPDSPSNSSRSQLAYLPMIAVGVLAIGGLVYAATQLNSPQDVAPPPQQASETESPPADASTPAPASPAPVESPDAQTDAPIAVNVTLTGESWLRVTVDGRTEFEGILPSGTQRTWSGNESLTIRAGNAGAVTVGLNGGEAQPLGRLGTVETATFTPTSAPARPPS